MSDKPTRTVARMQPQVWINNEATDAGPAVEFDVTDQVLALGKAKALAIRDNREESDALLPDYLREAHRTLHGDEVCFYVEVQEAIADYFGVPSWKTLDAIARSRGLKAPALAALFDIHPDRLHGTTTGEIILLLLEQGDDPEWIEETIKAAASPA